MMRSEKQGYWRKRARAFRCAGCGVGRMFRDEAHARIHLLAVACVVTCGFLFSIAPWEWCIVIILMGAVLAAEAVNTAIEKLADRITRDNDPLIGAAKDVAAGAVLILAATSVAAGLIIFLPKIIKLF